MALGRDQRQSESPVNMSACCERIHGTAVKLPVYMNRLMDDEDLIHQPHNGWAWDATSLAKLLSLGILTLSRLGVKSTSLTIVQLIRQQTSLIQ
jgi:hypothetical protein